MRAHTRKTEAPALVAGCIIALALPGTGLADPADTANMSPAEYAQYLIFESDSYDLKIATQEGKTGLDRMTQDKLQKTCSRLRAGEQVPPAVAAEIAAEARASIRYPEGGIKLGNWEEGAKLADNGFGYRLSPAGSDDHSKVVPGANCYACHQMDPRSVTYGTIGPSLSRYGAIRGNTEATRKWVYEIISDPHAYFPCTRMPRFGHNGVLTEAQISDVMAYLLDPESTVNKY